ncbi:MAG: hypothetical protein DRI01_00660 [Chloroflexi bacterium]|nr:MAG: hypothetical protein DRI01_00660 [Chloroflexota bacterium]
MARRKKGVRKRLIADQKQIRAIAYWITRAARSKAPLSSYSKTQLKRLNRIATLSPERKAYIKRWRKKYKAGRRRKPLRSPSAARKAIRSILGRGR